MGRQAAPQAAPQARPRPYRVCFWAGKTSALLVVVGRLGYLIAPNDRIDKPRRRRPPAGGARPPKQGQKLSLLGILTCGTTSTSLAERKLFSKSPLALETLKDLMCQSVTCVQGLSYTESCVQGLGP